MIKNKSKIGSKSVKNVAAKMPNYTLSDKMVSLVAEITEIATHLEMRESAIDPLWHVAKQILRMSADIDSEDIGCGVCW